MVGENRMKTWQVVVVAYTESSTYNMASLPAHDDDDNGIRHRVREVEVVAKQSKWGWTARAKT